MPDPKLVTVVDSPAPVIPLVELSAELRRLGANPPSCGSLRNAGYSGAFPIEKRAGKLVVRRADLPAIARLYSANATEDAAAA